MKRGRILESLVIKSVEEKMKLTITTTGLILSPTLPFFGASPDGLTDDMVIEVKCPSSNKSMKAYVNTKGEITDKCNAQVQLQMHMSGRKKALFCVANPKFETNNFVNIVTVLYDRRFVEKLVGDASNFWEKNVWPLL